LKSWLGEETYARYFHWNIADTMIVAQFLNDRAAFRCEKVPFSKKNLSYICSSLNIPTTGAHDALQDCIATAEAYHRMMRTLVE